MIRYIAKPNTWFKAGTEVQLIDDYRDTHPFWNSGLFRGIRITENSGSEGGYPEGVEREDEEICSFDEFEAVGDL